MQSLYETSGSWHALVVTFWKLPLIYLAMMVVRGLCICLLNPIFRLAGSHMSAGEILFSTVGGLRGAISLILAQMLVTQSHPNAEQKVQQRVQAQVRLSLQYHRQAVSSKSLMPLCFSQKCSRGKSIAFDNKGHFSVVLSVLTSYHSRQKV